MAVIRFSAPTVVFDFRVNGDDPPVVEDPTVLATLDGLKDDGEFSVFSDYIIDSENESIKSLNITGGVLAFVFDPQHNKLFGTTEYVAPRELSEAELAALKDFTISQWNDGIGSGFFQKRMRHGLAPQFWFANANAVSVSQRS